MVQSSCEDVSSINSKFGGDKICQDFRRNQANLVNLVYMGAKGRTSQIKADQLKEMKMYPGYLI